MNRKLVGRRFLVFGFISILGVFVLLILLGSFGANSNKKDAASAEALSASDKITLAVPTQKNSGGLAPRGLNDFENAVLGSPNATRDLATKIAGEIIARNPNGPGPLGSQKLQLMKPSEVVDKLTAQSLAKFDPSIFSPSVDPATLHIVPDSKENFEAYFRALSATLKTNFSSVDLRGGGDLAKVNFAKAASAYAKTIDELRALPVPAALAELHRKEIELVMAQKNVTRALTRYNEDPLQAYLALNIGDEINNNFDALNKEIADFLIKHELAI